MQFAASTVSAVFQESTVVIKFKEDVNACFALPEHIKGIKILADANRHIFGFVTRAAFNDALQSRTLIVATRGDLVVGFLRYHHRKRDLQTTLYDICVSETERGQNVGQRMLRLLIHDCCNLNRTEIFLKCPSHLEANAFYEKNGFCHISTLEGKRRNLNVWRLDLTGRGER